MNDFTKGVARYAKPFGTVFISRVDDLNYPLCNLESRADGELIASCYNTANALASQGIDAIKAIEALPWLINVFIETDNNYEIGSDTKLYNKLKSIGVKLKGEQE